MKTGTATPVKADLSISIEIISVAWLGDRESIVNDRNFTYSGNDPLHGAATADRRDPTERRARTVLQNSTHINRLKHRQAV
jgi:hypothetical protein